MAEIQLGVIEARYADMIWEHEPVSSSELVKLTEEAFHWKRTTAHNVLRRLCDKGLLRFLRPLQKTGRLPQRRRRRSAR